VITLGPSAHELRRELGPTAWVVLEDLVTRSHPTNGGVAVDASTASIIESSGLGRDAVRSALRSLARAGVVVTASARDEHGRFASNLVELHFPANTIVAQGLRAMKTAARSPSSTISSEGSAGAGEPAAGKSASVVNATPRKQRPARTTSTRPTARNTQLSLLNPEPAKTARTP
jgi:hypothetical protein